MNKRLTHIVYLALALAALLLFGHLFLPVLMPFLIGALLAYISNPLVIWLERWPFLSRPRAVITVFALLGTLFVLLLLVLIPATVNQFVYLYQLMPKAMEWMQANLMPWLQETFGLEDDIWQLDRVKGIISGHLDKAPNLASMVLSKVTSSGIALFAWIANLLLIPVVTYYLLVDWPRFTKNVQSLIPERFSAITNKITAQCDEVVATFVHGQLMIMLVLGIFYASGLALVGLELALIIGVIAGCLSLVPNLGFIVGLILAMVAGLFQFGITSYALLGILVVFVLGKILETTYLTQALVGDRIGLHPVVLMFALMAGSHVGGFTGLLLSLPLAAIILVLLRQLHGVYLESELYLWRPQADDKDIKKLEDCASQETK